MGIINNRGEIVNDGGTAFPVPDNTRGGSGMTRRQWLVGMIISGLVSSPATFRLRGETVEGENDYAELAHVYADAILEYEEKENAEREKGVNNGK